MAISETEAKLQTHEEVCELRYEMINARLKRMEHIMMGSTAFIIVTLMTMKFH